MYISLKLSQVVKKYVLTVYILRKYVVFITRMSYLVNKCQEHWFLYPQYERIKTYFKIYNILIDYGDVFK